MMHTVLKIQMMKQASSPGLACPSVRGTAGEAFIYLVSTSSARTDHLLSRPLNSPESAGELLETNAAAVAARSN